MCKAPKPPAVKEPKKPQFMRNRYLDEFVGDAQAVRSLKTGRDRLRIPAGVQAIGGRQPGESLVPTPRTASTISPANPNPSALPIAPRGGGRRDPGVDVQRR